MSIGKHDSAMRLHTLVACASSSLCGTTSDCVVLSTTAGTCVPSTSTTNTYKVILNGFTATIAIYSPFDRVRVKLCSRTLSRRMVRGSSSVERGSLCRPGPP